MSAIVETSEQTLIAPARAINALADPARLRIANLIRHGGEVCSCQIGPITGYQPSKISRHVSLMKQANLLNERREGTYIYYQFKPATDPFIAAILSLLDITATIDPLLIEDRETLTRNCAC